MSSAWCDRRWFASVHLFSEADADLRADEDFVREEPQVSE
jgi:hypothetical protein